MGGTLSCLAPNDSQGASLSKKHPGRAEAIAEYKARKNAGKPRPETAKINLAAQVEPRQIDAKPIVEKSFDDEVKEDEKVEGDTVQEAKEEVEEEAPEVDGILELKKDGIEENVESKEEIGDKKEEATKDVVEEEAVSPEPQPEEKTDGVDDVVAADAKEDEIESDAIVEEKKPADIEVEDAVTPIEKEVEPLPEVEELDEPTAIASEAILTTPTLSPLISARRHIFEMGDDTIPEAKDLAMDVKDPVTGDMVTLAEYRRRQSERAKGVVKEHVEKYESIDEKALKEMETRKLQEESRAKGREGSRNWTVPEPSSPSSPKPTPPEKDFTIQTL